MIIFLFLPLQHTLSNVDPTAAGLDGYTADTNLVTTAMNNGQPSNISGPVNGSLHSGNSSSNASFPETGHDAPTPTADAYVTGVNGSDPGAPNGTSKEGTTAMVLHATPPAHHLAPLPHHTQSALQEGPGGWQPSKGGTAALRGLTLLLLWAPVGVLLSQP